MKEHRCRALSITHKFGGLPPYPNGIAPQSPGLGGTSYPGENAIESTTPSWVANPVGLQVIPSATRDGVVRKPRLTQGRRSCVAPTLGFEPESLWDSNIWSKNLWVMLRARHRCSFTPPHPLQPTHLPRTSSSHSVARRKSGDMSPRSIAPVGLLRPYRDPRPLARGT